MNSGVFVVLPSSRKEGELSKENDRRVDKSALQDYTYYHGTPHVDNII